MLDNIIPQAPDWISNLLTPEILYQVSALVLIVALGWIIQLLLKRTFISLKERTQTYAFVKDYPQALGIFTLLNSVAYPLVVWILTNATAAVFTDRELTTDLLIWFAPFIGIWTVYRLLVALANLNIEADRAHRLRRNVIRPIAFLVALLHALGLLTGFLEAGFQPTENMLLTIRSVMTGTLIIIITYVLAKQSRKILREKVLPSTGLNSALIVVISTLAFYTITIGGILSGLQAVGFGVSSLAWIAGGLSVGLGFGLQNLINNFVSGFIILFERALRPGDLIDVSGNLGTVKDVGLRATQVKRIKDNVDMIVPNGKFLNSTVLNYSSSDARTRLVLTIRASYRANPHEVARILRLALDHPAILTDPAPKVLLSDLSDDGFTFWIGFWIGAPKGMKPLKSEIYFRIWDLFEENGIEIPPPRHEITVHPGSDASTVL